MALFIAVEVKDETRQDAALAKKLEEVCPVDIFQASASGLCIVEENLDECVLCDLCVEAAPGGAVRVVKLYEEA
jgi:NAD-dependent dihydropyrimidine dehydrogenase PreA subunit